MAVVETVLGAFTGVGASDSIEIINPKGFNICLWGTFTGAVQLERSFDGGTTWRPKTPSEIYSFTAPASIVDDEPEADTLVRLVCTAFTAGPINYRIGQ